MIDGREIAYWETHCFACEWPLRNDGGCSKWYGEPHTLPYRDRPQQCADNNYSVKLDRE